MKAYLFDTENGLYQGETFVGLGEAECEEGITSIPVPAYHCGEIPLFDARENNWKVLPVQTVRQQLAGGRANSGVKRV